jgi:hypothetical protein
MFFVIQILNTKLPYSTEENGYRTLSGATVPTNAMEGNLSDRLTVTQLCKKFPATYRMQKCITLFIKSITGPQPLSN